VRLKRAHHLETSCHEMWLLIILKIAKVVY
jgi:hypothetical protein